MKKKELRELEFLVRQLVHSVSSDQGSEETRTEHRLSDAETLVQIKQHFTRREMDPIPDLSEAEHLTVKDNKEVLISAEGVYVLSGSGTDASVIIEADKKAKVQLVLDGVNITNTDRPCIFARKAGKVFITTALATESNLAVTGIFDKSGKTKMNAVILSKADLVLNGGGSLTVTSTEHGISSKGSVKITGGTVTVNAERNGIKAKSAIRIANGDITVNTGNDGLQVKDNSDSTTGFVYMIGGSLTVNCVDDAIHARYQIEVDGGTLNLTGREGLESTLVTINGGDFTILASDDGINAGRKSKAIPPKITITGGTIRITTEGEQPDGIDSNGDIAISGGTIDITSDSPFDYTGTAEYTGGIIIINGEKVDNIPPSQPQTD